MKKTFLLCILFLQLFLVCTYAHADTTESNIEKWANDVAQLQQTGFLTRWADNDQTQMQELLNRYQLLPDPSSDQTTPADVLNAVFESCYGDSRFWAPAQMNAWDSIRYQWGLTDRILYILPQSDDGTMEQAIDAGWQEIMKPENAQAKHYRLEGTNFSDYAASAHFLEYEEGKVWWVQFYARERTLPTFEVYLWKDSGATVSYTDFDSIEMVYTQWIKDNNMLKFSYWSLETKAQFYQLMLSMWEDEMDKRGQLPTIAAFVLSHHHTLPAGDEIDEKTALALAAGSIPSDYDLSGLKTSVFFYRDDGEHGVYEINYVAASPIYTAWVDANTGTVTYSKK